MKKQEWENFYNSSTLHGFRFLFGAGAKWRRIIWLIILISSLAFVSYQLVQSVKKYRKYPTATSMQEVYPRDINFPGLNICYRLPILLNKLVKDKGFKKFLKARKKRDWTPRLVLQFLKYQQKKSLYRHLMKSVSQTDKSFIRSTKFNGRSYKRQHYKFVLHNFKDFCYSFNNNDSALLKTSPDATGSSSGLSVILKVAYISFSNS